MTTAEFINARILLGMNAEEMARALGLRSHGARTVRRIENGAIITGPMALAVQKLLDDAARSSC